MTQTLNDPIAQSLLVIILHIGVRGRAAEYYEAGKIETAKDWHGS
jgi:hypothetical protein